MFSRFLTAENEDGISQKFHKRFGNGFEQSLLTKVKQVIESIESAESLQKIQNRKKLKGEGNYFRLRIGDYRPGFALENDRVIFVRFLHRKDIYKFFP